eukprot:752991-Hanusia_phi.AAC.6
MWFWSDHPLLAAPNCITSPRSSNSFHAPPVPAPVPLCPPPPSSSPDIAQRKAPDQNSSARSHCISSF